MAQPIDISKLKRGCIPFRDIGLELKPSKTRISHTLNEYEGNIGFNFLGFNIRQYPVGKCQSTKSSKGKLLGFKTIIKPSKEKIKAHVKRLGEVITLTILNSSESILMS